LLHTKQKQGQNHGEYPFHKDRNKKKDIFAHLPVQYLIILESALDNTHMYAERCSRNLMDERKKIDHRLGKIKASEYKTRK